MSTTKQFETGHKCWINTKIWPRPENNRKPLMVLLHYWGGSSETWHRLTAPNSPTSLSNIYPTIAVDLRGWGESRDQPSGLSKTSVRTFSIAAMALDVGSILRQMKADPQTVAYFDHGFVLVGHSMGAKVALATTDALGKIQPRLKGFVLIAPAPVAPLVLPREMSEQQQSAYESEESVRDVIANVLAEKDKLKQSDVELVVRDILRGNPVAKKAWPAYAMEEDISGVVEAALRHFGGSFSNPAIRAVVLYGDNDRVEPERRIMKEVIPFLQANGVRIYTAKAILDVKHLIPFGSSRSCL
ncbi:Alpha/Beta hydrolase protein [Penicillium verhagenii]|nr:Alpha/Beta hydrolase protein [Penicillium verhagenii]